MAVVAQMVTSSGVRVRIHDDDIAPRGSEAAARIAAEQCRAARAILVAAWERGHDADEDVTELQTIGGA